MHQQLHFGRKTKFSRGLVFRGEKEHMHLICDFANILLKTPAYKYPFQKKVLVILNTLLQFQRSALFFLLRELFLLISFYPELNLLTEGKIHSCVFLWWFPVSNSLLLLFSLEQVKKERNKIISLLKCSLNAVPT